MYIICTLSETVNCTVVHFSVQLKMVGYKSVQDSVQSIVQWKPVGFKSVQDSVQISVQWKMVGFNSVQDSVQQSSEQWKMV